MASVAAMKVICLMLVCTIVMETKVVRGQDCKFCSAGEIYVDSSGGYRNILVSIHDNVTYNADIIDKIEAYLNAASQSLFTATQHVKGRYFADVTILVPSHWPSDPSYTTATTENPKFAAFVVRTTEKAWKHNPHTVRSDNGCGTTGVAGEYITLPDQYLTEPTLAAMFGSVGKTLVHEWAHYRYGVFDESDDEDGGQNVGCAEDASNLPPRCERSITGKYVSSDKPGYCIFLPNIDGQTADASLMYAPYLDSVYTFCDDADHNQLASNKHNSQCNQRSVWDVLRSHPDFSSALPAAVSAPPIQFKRVQENIQRIVIIMDVSGSMAGNRLMDMQKDVEDFIWSLSNSTLNTGIPVEVGMVEFSTVAQTDHALVRLDSTTAKSLVDAIPITTTGSTCIGCGILEGIELLKLYGGCGKRGLLYVFTDGAENVAPTIADVRDEVCACNATVYALIVDDVANNHPLKVLATDTCGSACVYDDNQTITMYECLMDATSDLSPHLVPVQIAGYVTQRPPRTSLTENIVIDEKLSPRVTFRFSWPSTQALNYNLRRSTLREKDGYVFDSDSVKHAVANMCDQITATVTTPEGVTIQPGSSGYVSDAISIDIVASSAQYGAWNYVINNPSSYTCDVRVTIESTAARSSDVVEMTFQVPKTEVVLDPSNPPEENSIPLYVTLKEGSIPVGNARVTAQVTKGTSLWVIDLLDNGAGADFRLNDGTYSRYFTEFNGDGVYSIRFLAEGVSGEVVLITDERSYGSGAPPLPDYRVHISSSSEPTGAFQRSAPGGYVQISGYTSLPPNMYPPAKIIDLSATPAPIKTYNATVNLTWTATGANLDKGIASHYDLRISDNATELSSAFETAPIVTASMVLIGDLTTPLEAGLREHYTLGLAGTAFDDLNTPYYVAIRAVNSDSVASITSNIAIFTFAPPPPCPPEEGGC